MVTTEESPKDATALQTKPSASSSGHNTTASDICKMVTTEEPLKDATLSREKPSPNSAGHNSPPSDKCVSKMVTTPKYATPVQHKLSPNSTGHNSPPSDKNICKVFTTKEAPKDAIPLQQIPCPNSAGHSISPSDKEGSSHVVLEKPSEDGYNWRKYGQKNVKGNEFIRSYYKCSFLNCLVKKQVERAHDGRITDTTYFGDHDHPKPPPNPNLILTSPVSTEVKLLDQSSAVVKDDLPKTHAPRTVSKMLKETHEVPAVSTSAEAAEVATPVLTGAKDVVTPLSGEAIDVATPLSSGAVATPLSIAVKDDSNSDQIQTPKRRKKVTDSGEAVADKPSSESRLVVETVSAVDIVNDGYRWRKYGQKLVRGNPNPRSYYRCSNPGCPAKKQVERASHDPRVVITAYEGQHDHNIPPLQTVLPHNTSTILSESTTVGSKRKPELQISPQRTPKLPEPAITMSQTEDETNKRNAPNSSNVTIANPKPKGQSDSWKTLPLPDSTSVPKKKEETSPQITQNSLEQQNGVNKPGASSPHKTSVLSETTNGAMAEQTEADQIEDQTRDSALMPEQAKEVNVKENAKEVGQTQDSASIAERTQEANVKGKDDSPSNLETQKVEQVITKQEELQGPDSGVVSSYPETQSKEKQKAGPEAVSC